MRDKRIVVLPLMLIIALSIAGFAYATWKDAVQIEGTVNMGSLTLVWDEKTKLVWTDHEDLLPVPKDVGWAEFYYDEDSYYVDPHTGKGGYETIIIKIHNAYPSYKVDFTTLVINNTGTIPAHFVEIIVTGYDVTDGKPLVFKWKTGFEYEIGAFWDDVDGDDDLEEIINVEVVNFVCHQLDPCKKTNGEIRFHFKEDAEECHTYTFKVEIVAVQWNKK